MPDAWEGGGGILLGGDWNGFTGGGGTSASEEL